MEMDEPGSETLESMSESTPEVVVERKRCDARRREAVTLLAALPAAPSATELTFTQEEEPPPVNEDSPAVLSEVLRTESSRVRS